MTDSGNGRPAATPEATHVEPSPTPLAVSSVSTELSVTSASDQARGSVARDPSAEPTLADMMSRVGERLSFTAALVICGVSVLGLAAVLAFGVAHWRLALFLVATGSFGAWTLSDHERRAAATTSAARWRLLQGGAAVLGVASVFVLFLTYLASALGMWIS